MIEIWKDIPGYEGKYQVSNTGEVESLNYNGTGKTKSLKQSTDKKGYKHVRLFKNGKGKTYKVHRLVAMLFIPNPNNLPIINHKDENKTNNNVNNLEWCTYEYNNTYGTARKRASEKMRGENNPNYGKHLSEEHRKKLSESMRGENNPNYGKHLGEEHKKKISESHKGEKHPFYGKHHSEESKKKISESMMGKKGKDNPNAKAILMYDKEGNFIRRFGCISDTNKYFGKKNAHKNVSSCLRGEQQTAYGFIFKYEDKEND